MLLACLLILAAITCYAASTYLTFRYVRKEIPGLLELDAQLPSPKGDEEYLWEKTAGTGIVPRWVSLVGLLAIPLFVAGILSVVWSLLRF